MASSRRWLRTVLALFIVGATVIAWQFPLGRTIVYPLTLFATYVHEMGHGLTALMLGQQFLHFELNSDGSGVAFWVGQAGPFSRALIAAGGLVGPSLTGALLLVASRRPWAQAVLFGYGVFVALSLVVWGRSFFAWLLLVPFSATILYSALKLRRFASIMLEFIALQLCLSVFSDLDYMFSPGAQVGGAPQVSDTQAMAEALWLPYWFWGGLTASFSFAVIFWGLWKILGRSAEASAKKKPLKDH